MWIRGGRFFPLQMAAAHAELARWRRRSPSVHCQAQGEEGVQRSRPRHLQHCTSAPDPSHSSSAPISRLEYLQRHALGGQLDLGKSHQWQQEGLLAAACLALFTACLTATPAGAGCVAAAAASAAGAAAAGAAAACLQHRHTDGPVSICRIRNQQSRALRDITQAAWCNNRLVQRHLAKPDLPAAPYSAVPRAAFPAPPVHQLPLQAPLAASCWLPWSPPGYSAPAAQTGRRAAAAATGLHHPQLRQSTLPPSVSS